MGLGFRAGAEADAGDAVAAHDGYAVGGEGPLVGQGAGLAHGLGLGVADPLLAEQALVGFLQSLRHLVVLRDHPGGEVALDRVGEASVGGARVVVHGYGHVLAVLFHGRKGADLV